MPSINMELTQMTSINTTQIQSLPYVSTAQVDFINSDVWMLLSEENVVNNAGNGIVCHSKSNDVNFNSNAHSHSYSHAETHYY